MKRYFAVALGLLTCCVCGFACSHKPPVAPGAYNGIPYGTCSDSGQCDYDHSMFGTNGNFVDGGCKGGYCRAMLNSGRQCGVVNDTVTCEKSRGVTGTSTCNNGTWAQCM
jgi:hypothetical protein